MRRPMPGSAPPTSIPLLSGERCMKRQPLARIAPRGPKMRRDGAAHFLPSRTKGKGVHAALLQLNLVFARRRVGGLSAAVFVGTAVLAQAPRSVTILPDVPEAPEAAPAPSISPMRLELLNATVKVENPAGVSVDLIPKLEVSAGSKIGFRIAAKKTGYLILVDIDASGKLTQIFPNPTAVTHGMRDVPNLIKPGRPLTIPQLGTPYAGFEFVADLPAGVAMVVALLSDKPVQVVDLPDTPCPAVAS